MDLRKLTVALSLALAGCPDPVDPPVDPQPVVLRTLTLTAGPSWDLALPPEEQDLAGHFEEVAERFTRGELLAYGPRLDSGLGFYVYLDETAPDSNTLLTTDPGIDSGVLALHEEASWFLTIDALEAPADQMFLLEYHPGPSWVAGLPLAEQDLTEHLDHVGGLVADGALLAGGPVNDMMGRYVVSAADQADAQALVDADPSVSSGLFAPTVHPWGVLQRQSVATALSAPN